MTVIAWDGKTLAADKRSVNAGQAARITKIARIGSSLVGVSGCASAISELRHWLEGGRKPDAYPDRSDDRWWNCIVIEPDGTLLKFEDSPYPLVMEEATFAIGSGRDFAMMAMHMGADARRAVELTCELSVDCGNGIDTLTLDGPDADTARTSAE